MAQVLNQRGWANVRPLQGGFDAWREAGYPVEPKGRGATPDGELAGSTRR